MSVALIIGILYLLILQREFLFSGDVWAETHMEYLANALSQSSRKIFEIGWAGYLTVIPTSLAKLYVLVRLPLGYIDIYYKFISVLFVLGCSAFCAARFNRSIFKNDFLRIVFSISVLVVLHDKIAFSFINIWYLGFVPLILISLNNQKLSKPQAIVYVLFGVLVSLTKPSLFMLPFLIYRAYKTKEYLSNILIAGAVSYQTVLMLFFDPRSTGSNATHNLQQIVQAVFTGGATQVLKLVHVVPQHYIYILVANLLLAILIYLSYKKYGVLRTGLVTFGYIFSSYAYLLAPDAPIFAGNNRYKDVYFYNFKSQREFLIEIFLLLFIFMALSSAYSRFKIKPKQKPWAHCFTLALLVVLMVRLYIPIDVESAGVAADIGSFRHSISTGQSVCVPLPPTPRYIPHANWQYEFNTICHPRHFELTPDFDNMNIPLKPSKTFKITNDTKVSLKTIYLVVSNRTPNIASSFVLKDMSSGMEFKGHIPSRKTETINFIPINVSGMAYRKTYEFRISTESSALYWGKFKENETYLYYPYFAETWTTYSQD